ncbi:MAG: beta-lactamase domain-containing protein [Acidobacteria bacterium OLB17]|nr:MAG: beta-lactamase domain-containing protein [Acidobacteria bacterium OLB17]MCZ2391082.1 MBL fold metallo-hydrolase [Acidobacteriota bacterium]
MHFKQFYLGCLSHASYYLGSNGEAVVIDPQRDVQQYLDEAAADGAVIKYVIETHSHADFVSGHKELAARTGAKIVFGQRAETAFETLKVKDGDVLMVGHIRLTIYETPGHTPESICLLAEHEGEPDRLFTGDTLFVGDVGRPDLVGSKGFTAEQMAAMLYDSLRDKVLPLGDETLVFPAHGAGSLCGRSLSKETFSTLGEQRRFNYALRPMAKDEFVRIVTADQPPAPAYFAESAARNLEGAVSLSEIDAPEPITAREAADFDGVVLDVRKSVEYGAGHIPNSINIGLGGQFASWAGQMVPVGTPIAIAAGSYAEVDEAVMRLARVGFETASKYVIVGEGGPLSSTPQVSVNEAADALTGDGNAQLIDVRRPAEYAAGHAKGAVNIPLDSLSREIERIDPERPAYVICQSGYRSSLASGILENAGVKAISNVVGGTQAWIDAGLETEAAAAAAG